MTIQTGIYQHYKGNQYRVLGTVTHSETEEQLVLYQPLYGEQNLWVRPLTMFTETVEIADNSVPRFKLVQKDDANS